MRMRFFGFLTVLSLAGCIDPQVGVRRTGGTAQNRVAAVAAAGEHRVQKGETLYAIAFKYAVDFRDIARWNGISEPYTIYPSQRLKVLDPTVPPVLEASAPRAASTATHSSVVVATIPATAAGATQTLNPQASSPQTLNAGTPADVGNGVSVGAIADPTPMTTAQPLSASVSPTNSQGLPTGFSETPSAPATGASIPTLPNASSPVVADTTGAVSASTPNVAVIKPNIVPSAPEAEIAAPIIAPSPGVSTPSVKPASGRNGWGWPVQGKLIGTFAAADPARQGIDIAGTFGDSVYSANAGEVVYSGRGIIGYGELIVIKHDDATLTAYGHNRKRLVKEGQRINQGERIAEMGKDPQGRALLHFELRRNGKPVDPLGVLPVRAR